MAGNRFEYSGMGNKTYGDIPEGATFDISSIGNVTINGKIGRGAVIRNSAVGNLKINGEVAEDVIFKISGVGNTIFAKRPPQSVLNKIENSGVGNITMPGGYTSARSTSSHSAGNFSSFPFGGLNIGSVGGITTLGGSDVVFGDGAIFRGDNVVIGGSIFTGNRVFGGGASFGVSSGGVRYDSIITGNGIIKVTQNGVLKHYRGKTHSLINGKLFIDSKEVTPHDSRIVSAEDAKAIERAGSDSTGSIGRILDEASSSRGDTKSRLRVDESVVIIPEDINFSDEVSFRTDVKNQRSPADEPVAIPEDSGIDVKNQRVPAEDPEAVPEGSRIDVKSQRAPADERDSVAEEKQKTAEKIFLEKCSDHTRQYIEGFAKNKSHREIVADLKLTADELKLFDGKCTDPITSEIMDRPIMLHDQIYDLPTIFKFKENINPFNRLKFEYSNISPRRDIGKKFERIIEKIKKNREIAAKASVPAVDEVPSSGPSFKAS